MIAPHVLKGIEMGLIPVECVIKWADQQIIAADSPEPWLIDLATATASNHDVISMMRERGASTEIDDDTFVSVMC